MTPEQFREPRWARFLFASQAAAWLWLVVRLYLAYIFIPAGWHKITSGDWLFGDGSPIMGMVGGAATAEGTPSWYVWFLKHVVEPNASLFATLVRSASSPSASACWSGCSPASPRSSRCS